MHCIYIYIWWAEIRQRRKDNVQKDNLQKDNAQKDTVTKRQRPKRQRKKIQLDGTTLSFYHIMYNMLFYPSNF